MLPAQKDLTVCFAHVTYRLQDSFAALDTGITSFAVRDRDELRRRIGEADVVVVSGLWHNDLLAEAGKLRFIQSISAGMDQYSREALRARGIRLASAQGVNARAVSEHAMALILAMSRRLPESRDNQMKRVWRGMAMERSRREDELGGKTLVVVGLGPIGTRLTELARAFDLRVIGVRRTPSAGGNGADAVHGLDELKRLLPEADFVALACPLTPETKDLIDAEALACMKPTAYLVNVARGGCVDEPALVQALADGRIAGAGLDVTVEEPLPVGSPLWDMPQVLITPHIAGDTQRYEDGVIEILMDNLGRLERGEATLRNQVI